jgi:hypothetical protein
MRVWLPGMDSNHNKKGSFGITMLLIPCTLVSHAVQCGLRTEPRA